MRRVDSLEKTLMLGGMRGKRRRGGMTEDEMAGGHHQLDAHEFGWIPGGGDGRGGLACCDSQGCKESDTTEGLNWTELNWDKFSGVKCHDICSLPSSGSGRKNKCTHTHRLTHSQAHTQRWNTCSKCWFLVEGTWVFTVLFFSFFCMLKKLHVKKLGKGCCFF